MKNLLLIIVMMLPVFSFANYDVKSSNDEKSNNSVKDWRISNNPELGYLIYHESIIYSSDVTLPFVVQVPAPPTGTLIEVNGPTMPSIPNWSISNGTLTITYTNMDQIEGFLRAGTCYIETRVTPKPETTYPYRNYAIRLIVL